MRKKSIIVGLVLAVLALFTIGGWLILRKLLLPTTSIYGIKVVPKLVDYSKLPWRMAGPGNVFEVPNMDEKEIAAILKKEGFQEDTVFHSYSQSPGGPYVNVDSHEFNRKTKAGTEETVAIMSCDGVKAFVHFELQDVQNPAPAN